MRKLLIVYNPQSSKHDAIQKEVLAPARRLRGFLVGKYEVKPTSFAKNVKNLERLIEDEDLVVAVGGDGTASIALNALMLTGKKAVFAALGYGNFCDIARMLGMKRPVEYGGEYIGGLTDIIMAYEAGKTREVYPLEVRVNEEHWRYAPCYMSAGLLACATEIFEEPKVRKKLRRGHDGALYSLYLAVKWYLKNRKNTFLPKMSMNGVLVPEGTTDYMAVNGPTLAKIMKGGKWWQEPEQFGSTTRRLGKFWRMVRFGLRSVICGVPLKESKEDVLEFKEESTIEIQVEGEFEKLEGVKKVEVQKCGVAVRVVGK